MDVEASPGSVDFDESPAYCVSDQFGPIMEAQFRHDDLPMAFHGVRADDQRFCDLATGQAFEHRTLVVSPGP